MPEAVGPIGAAPACASCGEPALGLYCHACGERRPAPDDERIGAFLRDQFHEVTSADGRLWRTLRGLFVPGWLTAEFFAGRRGLYVRPVRLFLVVNVVLFFLLRGNNGTILKGPLHSNFSAALYGPFAERLALDTAARWGTDLATVQTAFDAHATGLAPTVLAALIPAFALLFAVALWPVRARGVRHLVLATHTVAALLAGSLLAMLGLWILMSLSALAFGARFDSMDPVLVPTVIVGFCLFLRLSVCRVYGIGRAYATAVGLGIGTLGFAFAFWVYRLVLFFVTIWTLDAPP